MSDGLFFVEARYSQAKKHCVDCPVLLECGDLGAYQTVGVFGGLLPEERPQHSKGRRRSPQHGMNSKYVDGCRCDLCTRAHREAALEYETRRRASGDRSQTRIPRNLPRKGSGEAL